jgi:hypothetical protein
VARPRASSRDETPSASSGSVNEVSAGGRWDNAIPSTGRVLCHLNNRGSSGRWQEPVVQPRMDPKLGLAQRNSSRAGTSRKDLSTIVRGWHGTCLPRVADPPTRLNSEGVGYTAFGIMRVIGPTFEIPPNKSARHLSAGTANRSRSIISRTG